MKHDLKSLTLTQLRELVTRQGGAAYGARYLFNFMHQRHVQALDAVTPLPQVLRRRLADGGWGIDALRPLETFSDPDGTVKYLWETASGHRLESVCLRDGARHTLCISSQSGCRMGCRFCATGQGGYRAQLSAGQIVDQLYQVERAGTRVHNLVFMGMGEPFDNADAVFTAIALLKDPAGLGLGQRRITVSTCGLPEGIARLAREEPQVRLAVSLHVADDGLRDRLMPINQRHRVDAILAALRDYQGRTRRRVTIEICLLRGVNDGPEQARALIRRLGSLRVHVNLIAFNGFPGCDFEPSDGKAVDGFAATLRRAGLETVVRYRRGRSIRAACGQLGADWLDPGTRC